ncbi:MAG TPA: ABC transporter permease [Clostridiales bacterium]|nr:ABC transporter permease [Clostridiales bacterium]
MCLVIQARSGQFFTPNNIVDQANAMIVSGIFAVGAFMVIISGGIDVSFPALASLSVYVVVRWSLDVEYQGNIIVPLIMVCGLGALLGALNGLLVSKLTVSSMILTLGTSSVFRGIMQGVLEAGQMQSLPRAYDEFAKANLFVAQNAETGITSNMPALFLVLVAIVLIAFFIMRYTMFGRAIYAIGGDENSAKRAGFNVGATKFWLYVLVGAIASVAGLIRTCQTGIMHPTNLMGSEMMVIAAVVLGGTAITGGVGTLTGAMLGTVLISIVQNSLILLGVPTFWQGFFLGVLIIVGTGISAMQVARQNNKLVGIKQ